MKQRSKVLKLKWTGVLGAAVLLLGLAACGPADANTAVNEAVATATALVPAGAEETLEALASDPTVEALASEVAATIEAAVSDPGVQAALDEAFNGMEDTVTLEQGQALTLDALSAVPDVSNYTMTVVEAPAGAEASEGKVIKEASGGNISINPDEYGQYFTTAGDYTVRLDVTTTGNQTASNEFTVTVP